MRTLIILVVGLMVMGCGKTAAPPKHASQNTTKPTPRILTAEEQKKAADQEAAWVEEYIQSKLDALQKLGGEANKAETMRIQDLLGKPESKEFKDFMQKMRDEAIKAGWQPAQKE